MSLAALALLIAATQALRSILAGSARVLMAPGDPVAEALGGRHMVVALYAGDEKLEVTGRRLLDGSRVVELTIQILIPAAIDLSAEGAAGTVEAATEDSILGRAVVYRAVETAFGAEFGNRWCSLLREIALGFASDVETRPFIIQTESGASIAAAELMLPCKVVEAPVIGAPAPEPWTGLLAAIRATDGLAAAANLIEALIVGKPLADWQREQVLLGLSDGSRRAFGIGPLFNSPDVYPATELTVGSAYAPRTVTADTLP